MCSFFIQKDDKNKPNNTDDEGNRNAGNSIASGVGGAGTGSNNIYEDNKDINVIVADKAGAGNSQDAG